MMLRNLAMTAIAAAFVALPTMAEEAHHPGARPQVPPAATSDAMQGQGGPGMRGMGMPNMRGGGEGGGMMMGDGGMQVIGPLFGMHMMGPVERVEGRLAFLKTELAISAAQDGAWAAFADKVRSVAKASAERPGMMSMMQAKTAPERLKSMEAHMAGRLEAIRTTSAAVDHLYSQLAAEQKKSFDELLAPPMGMMGAR